MLKLQKAAMLLRSSMTPAASRLAGDRSLQPSHAGGPGIRTAIASAEALGSAGGIVPAESVQLESIDSLASAADNAARALDSQSGSDAAAGLATPMSLREAQEAAVGWDPHLVRRSGFADEPPPDAADEAAMRRELGFPVPGAVLRVKNLGEWCFFYLHLPLSRSRP